MESMTWTGRNTRDVRTWLEGDNPAFRLLVLRNASGNTQAWSYIKEPEWTPDQRVAVWDRTREIWLPVRRGDTITRFSDGSVLVLPPD